MPFFFQTVAILLWGTIWLHPAAIPELNSMFEEVMEPREVALTLTLKILHPPSVCRALNTGGQRRVNITHRWADCVQNHAHTKGHGKPVCTVLNTGGHSNLPVTHNPPPLCRTLNTGGAVPDF